MIEVECPTHDWHDGHILGGRVFCAADPCPHDDHDGWPLGDVRTRATTVGEIHWPVPSHERYNPNDLASINRRRYGEDWWE
jgi:hypothetical protein